MAIRGVFRRCPDGVNWLVAPVNRVPKPRIIDGPYVPAGGGWLGTRETSGRVVGMGFRGGFGRFPYGGNWLVGAGNRVPKLRIIDGAYVPAGGGWLGTSDTFLGSINVPVSTNCSGMVIFSPLTAAWYPIAAPVGALWGRSTETNSPFSS